MLTRLARHRSCAALVVIAVQVVQSQTAAGPPSGHANAFEQVIRMDVDLDRALDSAKCKPGDKVTAHPRAKMTLLSGFSITRDMVVTGHVLQVDSSRDGKPSTLTVGFDRLEPRKGNARAIHSTILSFAAAPDYLHATSTSKPLDRTSVGVGSAAGASMTGGDQSLLASGATAPEYVIPKGSTGDAVTQKGTILQRNGIRGVDLHSNVRTVASGAFTSTDKNLVIPAGTILSLLIEVRMPDAVIP